MCRSSVEPRPSTIAKPYRRRHSVNSSAESVSAAEMHRRRLDRSRFSEPECDVKALYSVGRPNRIVGRYRSTISNTDSGSGRPGWSTVDAPTEKGNVSELPKP